MKKVIALFLTVALALSSVIAVYAEDTDNTDNNSYSHEFEVLSALGFADGLKEHYRDFSEDMTRADFVGLCARLTGRVGDKSDSVFSDVTSGGYMEQEINTAAQIGLISKADTFMPDEPITSEQACKIIVSLLGYNMLAELDGGYPTGYVKQASKLGLTKKILGKNEITKQEGLDLIYKALSADVLQFKGSGYQAIEGETILSVNFDIYSDEGIVRANNETSLQVQDSSLGENYIKIDDEIYYCGDTNAKDLLGLKCEFYYRQEDSAGLATIMYIGESPDENEVINVLSADAVSCSGRVFKYSDENGKIRKKTISRSADVLYNGKAFPEYTDDDIIPKSGEIILIDNNKDGTIDVVFIYSHKDYYASIINTKEYIVTDKVNNQSLKLPIDDGDISVRIIKNGVDIDFSEVQKTNVLTVFESKNSDSYLVYVSDSAKSGIISSSSGIYDSDTNSWNIDQPTVTINGMECKVSLNCKVNFRIGVNATVYMNVYSEVVHIEYEEEYSFAYLLKATAPDSESEPMYFLRVLTTNDEILVLKLAKTVKLNGKKCSTIRDSFSLDGAGIWNYESKIEDNRKVIAYSLNSDGEINVLFTPVTDAPAENRLTRTITSEKNCTYKGGSVKAFFKSYIEAQTGKKLYETHYLDNDPVMFNVPNNNNDESLIRVIPLKRVRSDHTYAIDGFAFGEKGLTKVILKRVNGGISGDFTINYMLITDVETVWEDEEIRTKVTGLVSGLPKSLTIDEKVSDLEGLAPGSFIRYNNPITEGDPIIYIEVIFNRENNGHKYPPSASGYGFNTEFRTHYAKITDIDDGFVEVYDDHNGITYKYRTDGATVYKADAGTKKGKYYKADASEIAVGDYAFMCIRNEKLDALVVYK